MHFLLILLLLHVSGTTDFQPLNRQILSQTIGHESAKKMFQKVIASLQEECRGHVFIQEPKMVFPLTGYDSSSISKTAAIDYRDHGYDYFNGNGHLGHPAIDLNIVDNDRDGNDDNTKKPVKIVSMTEGVVIDVEKKWTPASTLKDGNFIWVYDFYNHQLVYYAHCNKVSVKPGDIISSGSPLGTVGRTGVEASKHTSHTHLHLMILKLMKRIYHIQKIL